MLDKQYPNIISRLILDILKMILCIVEKHSYEMGNNIYSFVWCHIWVYPFPPSLTSCHKNAYPLPPKSMNAPFIHSAPEVSLHCTLYEWRHLWMIERTLAEKPELELPEFRIHSWQSKMTKIAKCPIFHLKSEKNTFRIFFSEIFIISIRQTATRKVWTVWFLV